MNKSLSTINVNRILRTIWEQEPISRIDIARSLDLSKSTITLIVAQLIERGMVVEKTIGNTSLAGGRKPVGLGINPDYGVLIGIEFQTDLARVVAVSLDGSILLREQETLDFDSTDVSVLLERTIERYKERLENAGHRVIGAALGIAGIIDPRQRCIRRSNPLAIEEPVQIDHAMDERLGIPIFLENDSKCCCWADLASHRAVKPQHFMYVLGELRKLNIANREVRGLAVGMAFVIDGKVHYGHNYTSGEFSSIFKRDTDVTQFSIHESKEVALGVSDPERRQAVFEELADNIALVANLLNLRTVGFAGDIVQFRDELTPTLEEAIQRNWSYPDQAEVDIAYTPFGAWAVAYGAAAVVIEQLFALPKVTEEEGQSLPVGIGLFDLVDTVAETARSGASAS